MPDIRTLIVGLAVVASLMALWGWSEVGRYQDLYKTAEAGRTAAVASLNTTRKSLRAVESKNATSELRLRQVLAALPDRRTPDPVYNELCRRANCAEPGPMPSPTD